MIFKKIDWLGDQQVKEFDQMQKGKYHIFSHLLESRFNTENNPQCERIYIEE